MNAFIDMRRRYFESNSSESFAEYYLAHRCYVSDEDDAARFQLRSDIASVRGLYEQPSIFESDILRQLAALGKNLYLDRYRVEWILQQNDQLRKPSIQNAITKMLTVENIDPNRMLHLLDICIERGLSLLSSDQLRAALLLHRHAYDVFSVLLEYVLRFSCSDMSDLLYEYLEADLPENIRLQILDILIAFAPNHPDLSQTIEQTCMRSPHRALYLAYLHMLRESMHMEGCGIVVIQPMFYGDPEDSGKGKSGGLGTLLKTLGNQLSKQEQVSEVITLTINQVWDEQKPFLQQYEPGHWLVRLPVYLNAEDPHAFVRKELSIKRTVARFLREQTIEPDLFHIRYLDNASRTMALLSRELGAKLVFTLTPDPHRNMVDANGDLLCFKVEETLEKLNKVTIGDVLLAMTDGIVGIGGETIKHELELYFPQLTRSDDPSRFRMIGEGIDTSLSSQNFDVWQFIEDHSLGYCIHPENHNKPTILNVGRLNRQKGQHHLVQAWGMSRLWQDFNLIVIGGSRNSMEEEEQHIRHFIEQYMASNPHLTGRFAQVEALANEDIRRMERVIMTAHTTTAFPNIYVCSSVKEEFGISILEAMSEGYLVFVPVKGGAKTYIKDGVNGFLVDTTDGTTLMHDIERTLYDPHINKEDFIKIQHAGKRTVLDQFSIEEIAKRFLELYIGLSGNGELLCLTREDAF